MPPNRYPSPVLLAAIRRLRAALRQEGPAYQAEEWRPVALTVADVLAMRRRKPAASPKPTPRTAEPQRNPRICEECEGPCRAGAGTCDGCRRTRGERLAEDGVVLRPGPEPQDVFI